MLARKALAGTAGAPKEYVEDVFSTYLYSGTGSTINIVNGIDLSGDGGLVWTKSRSQTGSPHGIVDTARGRSKTLYANTTGSELTSGSTQDITSFNADGFSIGTEFNLNINNASHTYVSWTFRKAKKFFDVVTYTGTGSARSVSHNLGSTPGCIIIKCTSNADSWIVYHRSTGTSKFLYLNTTDAEQTYSWISSVGSTSFTLNDDSSLYNTNGRTYVAYLFAHDAGGFGDAGDQSVIKCGSYTGTSAVGNDQDLGFEPQWILIKRNTSGYDWELIDTMRGWAVGGADAQLRPNTSDAEYFATNLIDPTATGFRFSAGGATTLNTSGVTYYYIAIRRGPMKTPTSGTSVFKPNTYTGTGADQTITGVGFAPDFILNKDRNVANANLLWDRMRGSSKYLVTSNTAAEATWDIGFDSMDGFRLIGGGTGVNASGGSYVHWFFKRAPGFFDVVCYTGGNSTNTRVTHNLGVAPELIIVKPRSAASTSWGVYVSSEGRSKYMLLNSTIASTSFTDAWGTSNPTTTDFGINDSGSGFGYGTATMVAYLFASVSGVSKVGSYTGNGSSVTVTTDFQPRFIMVKRTDSTGNWIVSDSARGLVSGSDPYLLLNSTAAEDTDEDWVDVSSTGFTVNETSAANANVNTGTYIYLAIA